jgi:fucose 4-O-acetylase-like acetyltransferase
MLKQIYRFFFQEIPTAKRDSRLLDLDAARGLAIILVVIGHINSKGSVPGGNNWFFILSEMIYLFHMPLFMVLSGITFALSLPTFRSLGEITAYSLKRVKPLIVPYVALGLLIIVGKQVAVRFMDVSNPPGTFLSSAAMLVLYPTESAARFLWFIYVLSIFLVLVPPLFHAFGRRPVLLLAVGVFLRFFDWPEELAIQDAIEYLPFFALGMVLWIYRPSWTPVASWVFWPGAIVFVGLLALSQFHWVPKWLAGVSSILPLMGLVQRTPSKLQLFLSHLGRNSLSIYLFNVIVMGLVKGILFLVLPWDGINFFLYLPLLIISGVGVPLAIKAASQKWSPRVAKYI